MSRPRHPTHGHDHSHGMANTHGVGAAKKAWDAAQRKRVRALRKKGIDLSTGKGVKYGGPKESGWAKWKAKKGK